MNSQSERNFFHDSPAGADPVRNVSRTISEIFGNSQVSWRLR